MYPLMVPLLARQPALQVTNSSTQTNVWRALLDSMWLLVVPHVQIALLDTITKAQQELQQSTTACSAQRAHHHLQDQLFALHALQEHTKMVP